METISCDYIIVGAGSAGLASAQYAARSGLRTIVFDPFEPGGQALQIVELENYPGVFPAVTGIDFIGTMKKQAESFGARIAQAKIASIDKIKNTFYVHTESGEYSSFALLIATGAEHRMLGVPGEKELTGRGVSYCATCDGPFFRNKAVVVVGGGDSACTEALYPFIILRALIISAGNNICCRRHRKYGLNRRIRICTLGVVIISDSVNLFYKFYSVLNSMKCVT